MILHHIVTTYYPPTEKAKMLYDSMKSENTDLILMNAGSLKDSTDDWVKQNIVFEEDFPDNVCHLNPHWCELTSLYCVWKSLSPNWDDEDWVQHSHYRKTLNLPSDYQDKEDAVYVAPPYPMRFYVNHVLTQFSVQTGTNVCHPKPSWEALEQVVKDMGGWRECSEFDEWKNLSSMPAPINIFCMKVRTFRKYCEWLFERVCAIDSRIPYDNHEYRTAYQRRAVAYIGERLFSFWAWSRDMRGDIETVPVKWTLHVGLKPISDSEERNIKL